MAGKRTRYRRGRRTKKRGFASWSLGKKIAAVFGGTLLLAVTAGAVLIASKLSKIEAVELDAEALNVTEEARERGTGYLNVALFGVDSRDAELGEGTRSDTIMVASLNRETLDVKISSVYRDTLMEQKDGTLNKANAAYSFGGPEAAVAMLNKNLDMDIQHYVTVNFDALIDVVDAVGGIEVDVMEEEIPYICGYAMEIMDATGRVSAGVTEPGLQTLNGMQATAYARIRATDGDDYKRTERQRDVLTKVIAKLQQVKLSQLNKIIDKVFPQVSTNFTIKDVLSYAKDTFDYKIGETTGFPFDKTADTLNQIGSVVIPTTLASNVQKLHQFFYGTGTSYMASSVVNSIDAKITSKAGDRATDTSGYDQGIVQQTPHDYNYSGYSNDYNYNYNNNTGGGTGTGGGTAGGTGGTTGGTGDTGGTGGSGGDPAGGTDDTGGGGSGGDSTGGTGGGTGTQY